MANNNFVVFLKKERNFVRVKTVIHAPVAQRIERVLAEHKVTGSNPVGRAK